MSDLPEEEIARLKELAVAGKARCLGCDAGVQEGRQLCAACAHDYVEQGSLPATETDSGMAAIKACATGPWIPVTTRLPDRDPESNYGYSAEVLVELADGGHRLDTYNHDKGRWTDWRGAVAWAEIRRGRA